ncbi:hypothetical protein [Candidatus Berkiella aquae]|uniref:Uncharacterized protein n=1 Tax=Candidatus Berkiella aquae TaxID=295108 RepID=A0A0Q9YT10_9GAMM|nr:hypothetical protein [Candidatus Berkiella aquae]MCS5710774.1 hypothetical protein [Candidatus Berkiella aquae]
MSRFKNSITAALTGTGVSLLLNLPPEVAGPVIAGSFVTTFILPTAFDMTVNAGVGTVNWVKDQGLPAVTSSTKFLFGKTVDGTKFLFGKTKEALYNVSPTNPEQNTLMGASMGLSLSTSIAKAAGLEDHPYYPHAVAGSTVTGSFLGFIFPNHRISSMLESASKAFKPKVPTKLSTAENSGEENKDKDKKEKKKPTQ